MPPSTALFARVRRFAATTNANATALHSTSQPPASVGQINAFLRGMRAHASVDSSDTRNLRVYALLEDDPDPARTIRCAVSALVAARLVFRQ